MVYLYTLWAGSGDPPSPWQKVATWDGKYIRFHSNPSNAGNTGGSSSHTHANGSVSQSVADTAERTYHVQVQVQLRDHTHPVTVNIGAANNDPPYYTLSLIRVDADQWMSALRSFPVGAVVGSTQVLSATGYQRFSSADSRYIKLGTPGSTGGSSSHNHSVSVNFASANSQSGAYGGSNATDNGNPHTHSHSGTSSSVNVTPSYLQTRLYQIVQQLLSVPAGTVCMFDGAPPSGWAVLSSWDDRFLMSGDVNPTTGGNTSHDHGTYNGTTSGSGLGSTTAVGSGMPVALNNHRHNFSFSINSSDHMPPFVYLVPAYLTQDVFPPKGSMNQAIIL